MHKDLIEFLLFHLALGDWSYNQKEPTTYLEVMKIEDDEDNLLLIKYKCQPYIHQSKWETLVNDSKSLDRQDFIDNTGILSDFFITQGTKEAKIISIDNETGKIHRSFYYIDNIGHTDCHYSYVGYLK